MKIKNIFFDFDGVISESVSAKTAAFKEMYTPYGENIVHQVEEYHINNGGVSRFEKFKYWENTFFGKNISEERVQEMAQEFSDLVLEKVIHSKEVSGVLYFLKKYANDLNFWIITGTPTSEIKIIAEKKLLANYFIGIHGSPENKSHWTEYLIKKNNLKRDETLFLGDATTDHEASVFSKLHFALRENEENETLFKTFNGIKFKDFFELEEKLKNTFIIA
ncbi:HAD hydrolase-like protein [Polaribacter sp.]|nr:HAD hydrolase-like protein [Polaribacter sp.]